MKDNQGNEIKTGDILFYTERPHSNYADGLVEVYEDGGKQMVRFLVGNTFGSYRTGIDPPENNLELDVYSWNLSLKSTGTANDLTLIPDLTADMVTVEYADEHYPLSATQIDNRKVEDMSEDKLIPCPFCGGEVLESNPSWNTAQAQCRSCGETWGTCGAKFEGRYEKWNTRTPPEIPDEQ